MHAHTAHQLLTVTRTSQLATDDYHLYFCVLLHINYFYVYFLPFLLRTRPIICPLSLASNVHACCCHENTVPLARDRNIKSFLNSVC